jgi:hypothetical protein
MGKDRVEQFSLGYGGGLKVPAGIREVGIK